MILRRITQHVKDQNWTAIAIDFVIVVVGVFVGLQVNNWNAGQGDRRAEHAAIERLLVEHTENLSQLESDREAHHQVLEAASQLLSMIGPDPDLPADTARIARTLLASLNNPTFSPRLGATQSLIASGELQLIGDLELQSRLTAWPAQADEVLEWQLIERTHGEELIVGLTFEYIAWPDVDVGIGVTEQASRFDHDLTGLFSSRQFEGLLYNRRYNIRQIIEDIEALEGATTELIGDLRERQAQIAEGAR
ncbi:hypothetical protein [Rubrivirga sp. IMCC45206]|uniref:hypothetical protein n=1 Tax=Rubrivirga sp. IMCC45206 TaxID=3391614 RepID=UPI003990114F